MIARGKLVKPKTQDIFITLVQKSSHRTDKEVVIIYKKSSLILRPVSFMMLPFFMACRYLLVKFCLEGKVFLWSA